MFNDVNYRKVCNDLKNQNTRYKKFNENQYFKVLVNDGSSGFSYFRSDFSFDSYCLLNLLASYSLFRKENCFESIVSDIKRPSDTYYDMPAFDFYKARYDGFQQYRNDDLLKIRTVNDRLYYKFDPVSLRYFENSSKFILIEKVLCSVLSLKEAVIFSSLCHKYQFCIDNRYIKEKSKTVVNAPKFAEELSINYEYVEYIVHKLVVKDMLLISNGNKGLAYKPTNKGVNLLTTNISNDY